MTITLNERQIKALRALKQTGSCIAQYSDGAGWYVWIPKPNENDTVKVYKARLNLTCRDIHQMSHLGLGLLTSPQPGVGFRYITDKGRQYLEEIK
jgi:hypothetical protein